MNVNVIVDVLLENDAADFDVKRFVTKRPEPKEIAIYGRRWFRRTYGGTYFKFYVYVDGKLVHSSGLESGYGEYYLERGTQWLEDEGYIPRRPPGRNSSGWHWIRDDLKIPLHYSAIDVKRQKDT